MREKKERKEQLEKERREKKEEMDRIRKEKALQKQREKEEKLREKEEKLKEKEEKRKEKEERMKQLAKERAEKKQLKLQKMAMKKAKTPQSARSASKSKQRKPSLLDKWVKVTKYEDTSNQETPIIRDKTVSLTTPAADIQAMSVSKSPTCLKGNESSNKSLYEQLFAPFRCSKGSTMPLNYPNPPIGYRSVIEIVEESNLSNSNSFVFSMELSSAIMSLWS